MHTHTERGRERERERGTNAYKEIVRDIKVKQWQEGEVECSQSTSITKISSVQNLFAKTLRCVSQSVAVAAVVSVSGRKTHTHTLTHFIN